MEKCIKADAFIVGSSGQDAQILAEILNSTGFCTLELNKNELTSCGSRINSAKEITQKLLTEILKAYGVKTIYFTAANSYPSGQRNTLYDPSYQEKNSDVENLLLNCVTAAAKTGNMIKFVYFSSALRFGELNLVVNEETDPNPLELYGIHKIRCEKIVKDISLNSPNIQYIIPYFFNHTSHWSKPEFLLKKISYAVRHKDYHWLRNQCILEESNSRYLDLGSAEEYMVSLINLSKTDEQGSYIFSTGVSLSVGYFFQAGLNLLDDKIFETENSFVNTPFLADNSKLRNALALPKNCFTFGQLLLEELVQRESTI